jgi:hypothetical protein
MYLRTSALVKRPALSLVSGLSINAPHQYQG